MVNIIPLRLLNKAASINKELVDRQLKYFQGKFCLVADFQFMERKQEREKLRKGDFTIESDIVAEML